MALKNNYQNDSRGDKPASKGKEGLKFPLGSSHWENKAEDTMVADLRYASEMNTGNEYKDSVNALAGYVRKNKMSY